MTAKNPYLRTRRDHMTERTEDYVEAIADIIAETSSCRIKDLAKRFMVSHVTVTRRLMRLESERLVRRQPYGPVFLTARGKALANESKQRHTIVLQFLMALGVDKETAEVDTEGIEHHVSKGTLDAMNRFAIGSRRSV